MNDLVKRLRIKAGMIEMGEMIAWGSDSALMREAADALEAAAPAVQGEPDVTQAEQPSGVAALTSDLSARINRVSRRSLDGTVIMSSEEWNGIVKLVEKLLTAAPQPAEQQPAPDVSALVEALEKIAAFQPKDILCGSGWKEWNRAGEYAASIARDALAAYRKGGE